MGIADCALAGPGLAFMFCVSRIRELEAVRKVTPPIECVVRPPTAEDARANPRPADSVSRDCTKADSGQRQ